MIRTCVTIALMLKKHQSHAFLILWLCLLPVITIAQANAILPYSMVNNYLGLFKQLENLEKIIPTMSITSVNPEVSPEEIEFKIKPADDWVTFTLEENGVTRFEAQPDWDNLNLVSNQPKGSLQLLIEFRARRLESTRVTYQELMGLVPQFNDAMAALAEMQGQPVPQIKGLTIQMSEGSGASVNVLSSKRKTTLKSTSAGVIIIKYDDALWTENPPVEFDEIPIGIVPLQ